MQTIPHAATSSTQTRASAGKPRWRAITLAFLGALMLCALGARADEILGIQIPDIHQKIFSTNDYPSATLCAKCHPAVYDEWRSSAHAYASISPVFHKFDQRINEL